MDDIDKIEEEKQTANTSKEMQLKKTRGQGKTGQIGEAETEQEHNENEWTAQHIINNQQKNTEKQGTSKGKRGTMKNYRLIKIYRTTATAGLQKPADSKRKN